MAASFPLLDTIPAYVEHWVNECPDRVFLRDRKGDKFTEWTWKQTRDEAMAMAAWLEREFKTGSRMALVSRNRAHWMLADLAITASGNVSVPQFTTQATETAKYVFEFTDVSVVFVGEADNWDNIKTVVPDAARIVAFPGVDPGCEHIKWEDIVAECTGQSPQHECKHDELMSLVFTSGTTGLPKGVMQTHDSMLIPMQRSAAAFSLRENPRFLSYLPLSHIAERQLVWIQALIHCGEITFNESLATLLRDMADTKPNFFFGAPRVWEQLQQGVLAKVGGQKALDAALEQDPDGMAELIRTGLGLHEADAMMSAAAPISPALIKWFHRLGIKVLEGYGQTEAMVLIANFPDDFRIGSIGKLLDGVEVKISDEGELLVKATGLSTGYYKNPEKTAETFVDGWVHTGDKARIDEDGFVYLTGRVKDYFKTIQGKFVAPPPIEGEFAKNDHVEQLCLLGRGYSKTVMVCVLTEAAAKLDKAEVEASLIDQIKAVNDSIEKHARIGAAIATTEPWSIENGVLTPTLKIKRDEVSARFHEQAEALARKSAEQKKLLVAFV